MINIVGDINLTDGFFDTGFGVGSSIKKGNNPFNKICRNKEDLWIGNFEGVTSNISNKEGVYKSQFIISPKEISHLDHFDYYNVANNHSMQHGFDSFNKTLNNLKSFGSEYFGTDKKRSINFVHQNKKVSITSFSQHDDGFSESKLYWNNPSINEISKEYNNVLENDFNILYIHWGSEFINRPYNDQKRCARSYIDMGFDLIIGMHPHILQGFEVYRDKHIFYSLGNFVFNMSWEPLKYGAIIKIDFNGKNIISYDYIRIEEDYFPKVISADQVPDDFKFEYLNKLLNKDETNESYYKEVFVNTKKYQRVNQIKFIRNIFKFNFKTFYNILMDYFKRRVLK